MGRADALTDLRLGGGTRFATNAASPGCSGPTDASLRVLGADSVPVLLWSVLRSAARVGRFTEQLGPPRPTNLDAEAYPPNFDLYKAGSPRSAQRALSTRSAKVST